MTLRAGILARFSGGVSGDILYLPDLTAWYKHHKRAHTLPEQWEHYSLPQIAQELGAAVWLVAQPWRIEMPGINICTEEQDKERIIYTETPSGMLVSRWILGTDQIWRQAEYPVKDVDDLAVTLELVEALRYIPDSADLAWLDAMAGDCGIVAIEIPRRPYLDLLYDVLGGKAGLELLHEPIIQEILNILDNTLQTLIAEIAQMSRQIIFAPDELNGRLISPETFTHYLAASYQTTTEILHQCGQYLIVQTGGAMSHLLPLLRDAGVDGVEGMTDDSSDALSFREARQLVGADFTLWGGISQYVLLPNSDVQDFKAAVQEAVRQSRGDPRMLLGIANQVPLNADINKLTMIPQLIEHACRHF